MGHGLILAAPIRLEQGRLWAARLEGDPAGIPSGVGAWRLQPIRLRGWLCRPTPFAQKGGAMQDILVVVEEAVDGSYRASAAAAAIHTETGITGLETPQR